MFSPYEKPSARVAFFIQGRLFYFCIMNRRTQSKFKQLLIIVVAWLIVGFLIAVYDHQILYTKNSLGPAANYSFFLSAMLNMSSALFGALLGGSFLIFFINVKYRDKSYGYTVLAVTCSFILIVLFIHMVFMLLGTDRLTPAV